VQARIEVGSGPGWFVVTDDALWVSSQLGRGLNRIDPATNTSEIHAGDWPTCGRGVVALGAIWQPACDAHQLMRIDLATNRSIDLSWGQRQSVILVGDRLVAGGPDGLSRLDPETQEFTEIGGPAGWIIGFDGTSIWVVDGTRAMRVNPSNGKTLASLDLGAQLGLAFNDDTALLTIGGGLVVIDLATTKVIRSINLGFQPYGVLAAAGYLWVTNFDGSSLIRLEL
jgi:streptogramin lyase